MSKISMILTLIILSFAMNFYAQGSNSANRDGMVKKANGGLKVVSQKSSNLSKNALLTEDFSGNVLPTGWQNINNTGSPVVWEFDNPGGKVLNSTTGSNGFAICDSDFYGSTDVEDADLITSVIDCSAALGVSLSFEHFFDQGYGAVAKLYISNDNGLTWSLIETWDDSNSGENNAETENYNISSYAAGYSEVLIRWNWYAPAWCNSWAIDDIVVNSIPTSDAGIIGMLPNFVKYGVDKEVSLEVLNGGLDELNDFIIGIEINDGTQVVYSSSKNIAGAAIASEQSQFFSMDDIWTNPAEGQYNIIASIEFVGDQNETNDTLEKVINVADISYERDRVYGYERINTSTFLQNQNLIKINALKGNTEIVGSTGISEVSSGDYVGDFPNQKYVVTIENQLYVLNSDGVPYYYGEINGIETVLEGFTWDAVGEKYYVTDGKALYEVDENLQATNIGNIVVSKLIVGLAANSQGELYGIGSDDNLYVIDKTTGAGTIVGSLNLDISNLQDIAFDRENDILYGTLFSSPNGGLYTINLTTGEATLVGSRFKSQITACAVLGNPKYNVVFDVTDGTSPLSNAQISIDDITLNTDVNGQDSILLVSGAYPYSISLDGFAEYFDTLYVIGADHNENVTLSSGYTITFTVNDGSNPIENATIQINGFEIGLSDTFGQLLVDLSPGDYDYTVSAEGFFNEENTLTVVDSDFEQIVTLATKYNVTFNFTDENSQLLPGVSLSINDTIYTSDEAGVVSFLTGPGDYPYTASIAGYNDSIGTITVVDSDVNKNIMMTGIRYTVNFNVTDGTNPLSDILININATDLTTDADGEATIELPNGFYTYTATGSGYAQNSGFVAVAGGDAQKNIVMTELLYPVVFTVVNKLDDPLVNAQVSVRSIDSLTNANGETTVNLPVGSFEVITTFEGFLSDTVQINTTVNADSIDVVLFEEIQIPQNLSVFVDQDQATITWDQIAKVFNVGIKETKEFVSYNIYLNDLVNPVATDYSDSTYVFDLLTDGSYQAGVQKVYSTDSSEIVTIDFDILIEHTVTLTVTDGSNPIEGANVNIDDQDILTDATGVVAIEVPNGDYAYTITYAGYQDLTGSINVSDGDVSENIVMNLLEYTVTIAVTDGSNPIDGASVELTDNTEIWSQTTIVDGTTVFDGVVNGTYYATASFDGMVSDPLEIILNGDDVTEEIVLVGIQDMNPNFSLYPNPTTGMLYINAQGTYDVTVLNAIGNVVKTQQIGGNGQLNLSGFADGIYFIRLQSDNSVVTKRIILE